MCIRDRYSSPWSDAFGVAGTRWLKGMVHEYREWFNHSRFHRGIKALPADLYECNVRNLT